MKNSKLLVITLAVFVSLFTMNAETFAKAKIALVDMAQIVQNYDKAKAVQADLQVSQEQIKKMISDAREEVKGIEEEKARKDREKKLASEILEKNKVFKEEFSNKWEVVQTKILTTIKAVADKEQFDLVVDKQTVIAGGEDITKQVLSALKK